MVRSPFSPRHRALISALVMLLLLGPLMPARALSAQAEPANATCTTAGGYLLLQPRSALDSPRAGLIVVDPATGTERGRNDVPAVDAAFPTGVPAHALAISGANLFLVDAESLRATEIALDTPAKELSPNPVEFRGTAGTRYLLLGSPSFDQVYLIDANAGTAANLTALIPPPAAGSPVFIQFAAVTPDDVHVVLWDGQHVYVVPTADPTNAQKLDTGAFAFAPVFSPDGKELVYSVSAGPGSGSTLVSQSIEGGGIRELRSSDRAQVTLWVPGSRTVFIDERTETGAATGTVVLFDLDTKRETRLATYDGSLTTVQMSADGKHALLGIQQAGATAWRIADLEADTTESLGRLGVGKAFPGLYGNARWSLFVPTADSSSSGPLGGPAVMSIDLDTGDLGHLLDIDSSWQFRQQPMLSPDGRFALIVGQTTTRQKLWLTDAKEFRATGIAEAQTVAALFSPDGCYAAVTKQINIDGLPDLTTAIVPVSGDPTVDAGNGTALVWASA
jgi:hypothetical protein